MMNFPDAEVPRPADDATQNAPWSPPVVEAGAESRPTTPRRVLPSIIASIVALGVGVGLGYAVRGNPTDSSEYLGLMRERDSSNAEATSAQTELSEAKESLSAAESELATMTSELEAATAELSTIEQREVDVKAREDAVAEREAAADTRQGELDEREAAISGQEEAIAAASFGSGMHLVGTDIAPGTYRTEGGSGCYWERLSGTSGEFGDIISNDVSLDATPMVVTIAESDVAFKSNDCGTWTPTN